MEAAFGADFSGVGVRVGQRAALASIDAQAAASGEQIAFADAQPDRHTVAHELAHVMQYRRHGGGSPAISRPGDAAEREAEAVAAAVESGGRAPSVQQSAVTRADSPVAPDDGEPHHDELALAVGAPPIDPTGEALPPSGGPAGQAVPNPPRSTSSIAAAPARAEPAAEPRAAAGHARVAPAAHDAAMTRQRAPRSFAARQPPEVRGTPAAAPRPDGFHDDASTGFTEGAIGALYGTGDALTALHGVRLSELDATSRRVISAAAASHESVQLTAIRPESVVVAGEPPHPPALPTVARGGERAARTIEHHTGVHAPHRAGISAGPRPRVPLAGDSDLHHADAARRSGQDRLDARLAMSHEDSAADHGVSRLFAPVELPPAPSIEPRPPANLTVPEVPPAPWQALPAQARARLDAAVAPVLDRRITALVVDAHADTERATHQLAALQADHDARATARREAGRARIAQLRTSGAAQVTALRGPWQARGQALRDDATAQLHTAHAEMETEVQDTVRAGEQRSDTILSDAETHANTRQAAADARVAAIRARAEAQAAAARASSPGVATMRSIARKVDTSGDQDTGSGNDDSARKILEDAQAEIAREIARARQDIHVLITTGDKLSREEIDRRERAIKTRLAALQADLEAKVRNCVGDGFPRMEQAYVHQINTLLGDVAAEVADVADAARGRDIHELARLDASTLLDRHQARLQNTLQDAAVLSTFHDTDSALAAFGIKLQGWAGRGDFEASDKQDVLFEAIRIENAFRAAGGTLFDEAGLTQPGAAFSAMMNEGNGITLEFAGDNGGTGAKTQSADKIDFYTVTDDVDDWIANGTRFQFGHELGHAFNEDLLKARADSGDSTLTPYTLAGTGALDSETIITASGNVVVSKDRPRFVPSDADLEALDDPARLQALRENYEADGMRMRTHPADGSTPARLRDAPYQQDLAPLGKNEHFADIFVNWAHGTLADNANGDAINDWVNQRMPGWIQMGLHGKAARDRNKATGNRK